MTPLNMKSLISRGKKAGSGENDVSGFQSWQSNSPKQNNFRGCDDDWNFLFTNL